MITAILSTIFDKSQISLVDERDSEMSPNRALYSNLDLSIEDHDALVVLIELIRTQKAVTRADLMQISGLGRGIVSQRIDEAIRIGLVEDTELGISTGGRMPRMLRFRSELGCFFVMQFGASNLAVAISDLKGKPLETVHIEWDISIGPEKSLNKAVELIQDLLRQGDYPGPWGVIVGVPGPVDFEAAKPVAPPIMPGWNGFDIRNFMLTKFQAPCWVDNDANLMALGEHAILANSGANEKLIENLLYVKVGTGIGAGIISHGRVHRGANGSAGDIGHITLSAKTHIICRCGQMGCLEAIAGGWALARDAEIGARANKSDVLKAKLDKKGFLEAQDISQAARDGDEFSIELITNSGLIVGEIISGLVHFINPATVVFGGSIASTGDYFLAGVRQAVSRQSLPLATRDLKITVSHDLQEDGLLGGGVLAQSEIFSRSFMNAWVAKGTPRAVLN